MSGLKTGMKNSMFWSEIGSGFEWESIKEIREMASIFFKHSDLRSDKVNLAKRNGTKRNETKRNGTKRMGNLYSAK